MKAVAKTEDLNAVRNFIGVEVPELEVKTGKYYASTSIQSNTSWNISGIIKLSKGDKIVWKTETLIASTNIPALVLLNPFTGVPTSVAIAGIGAYQSYEYTATGDICVGFSYTDKYACEIWRASKTEFLYENTNVSEDFTFSAGYLAASNGAVTGTNVMQQHSELFALNYGDTITFSAAGYTNGSVAVLYEYDEIGTALRAVIAPTSKDMVDYIYTETKPIGYYKVSTYNNNTKQLRVRKYAGAGSLRDTIEKTSADKYSYFKYLFEKAIFIGDSLTAGVLGTTNGTNSKISYPYYIGKMTGWEITNAGHPSYTTINYWDNDIKTLDFSDKDVCFIYLGQNGGFTDTLNDDTTITDEQTYEDYAATNTGSYCKIIEYIKEQKPDIHIFMLVGGGTNATTVLPQIAGKYSLPCLDIYRNPYFTILNSVIYHPYKADGTTRDRVHLGRIGYLTVAKSVLNMTFDYINEHQGEFEYPYPS